jgi:hypothetical protein
VKFQETSLRLGKIGVVLLVIGGAVLSVSVWRSSAFKNKSNKLVLQSGKVSVREKDSDWAEGRQRFLKSVREGLSEVRFASRGSSDDEILASIESAAKFIRGRSGIKLSKEQRMRLAAMEAQALRGTSGRLSVEDLCKTFTGWVVERVSTLTDQELEQAVDTLRGFNSPDLPGPERLADRNYVHLRGSVLVHWTQAIGYAKSFRNRAIAGDEAVKTEAAALIKRELDARAVDLTEAAPEQFMVNASHLGRSGVEFTPLQSFLMAYSLVSDDKLTHSRENLERAMNSEMEFKTKMAGSYPSPDGHRAYGVNGYLHSSPVDIFFGKDAVDRLLALLVEGRQP